MSELAEVTLYTTPSGMVYPSDRRTEVPYRRIVGMGYGDGMQSEHWTPTDHFGDEGSYDRGETVAEILELPTGMAQKLVGFFERYFADGRVVRPVIDSSGRQIGEKSEGYNCHRFGYWMRGSAVADRFEVPDAPDFVTESFAIQGGVPMGRHSVLGIPGVAIHSVVGLGRENKECLQVLSSGGFMGIDTYEHILDYYDPKRSRELQFYL